MLAQSRAPDRNDKHQAQRERVFERFYRSSGSTERGSCLGLAIVKRITEREEATLDFVDGLDGPGLGLRIGYPAG